MPESECRIIRNLGIISEKKENGWKKEINIISWYGRAPKLDIREWSPDHQKSNKGITLSKDEFDKLANIMIENLDIIEDEVKDTDNADNNVENVISDKESVHQLETCIDKLFDSSNTEFMSAGKLYSKLFLLYEEVLKKTNIRDSNELFEKLQASTSKYFYCKPIVSLYKVNSVAEILAKSMNEINIVSFNSVSILYHQLNIDGNFTKRKYQELLEIIKDDYYKLDDTESFIKKDKLTIKEQVITSVSGIIDMYIDQKNGFDTKIFNGYKLLPDIEIDDNKYKCNKYILYAIVDKYLKSKFILNTEENEDFIVERRKQ